MAADYLGQFMRTGNEAIAVDFGIGIVAACTGFLTVWCAINRGWGDSRARILTLVAIAAPVCALAPDAFCELGKLIRGMFFGFALPAVGWLSFLALVLLAGFAGGYMARRSDVLQAQGERHEAETLPRLGERIKPAVSQARAALLSRPHAEPARATRQQTAVEVRRGGHVR